MRRRSGFSFVELLVVLTVLGILVRLAVPYFTYVTKKATARAAVADVRVIRDATFNFQQDKGKWPADAGSGQTPPDLVPYLPTGFSFKRGNYELDFEAWGASPGSAAMLGAAVDTSDPALANEIRKLGASGIPYFVSGSRTTFVLSGLDGIS
jgi:prepilin-type N-terminal cleavage/methylation domain-containing protein